MARTHTGGSIRRVTLLYSQKPDSHQTARPDRNARLLRTSTFCNNRIRLPDLLGMLDCLVIQGPVPFAKYASATYLKSLKVEQQDSRHSCIRYGAEVKSSNSTACQS